MQAIQDSIILAWLRTVYAWFGRQWAGSRVVRWFTRQPAAAPGKLWTRLRTWYIRRFRALGMGRFLEGSIFLRPGLFAAAAVILLPLVPTMAVLALVCGSFLATALALGVTERPAAPSNPLSKFVVLYAGIYLYSTLTSTAFKGSLFPGMLTVLFVLFFLVLTSCSFGRREIHLLVAAMLAVGVVVSLYGFYQHLFPNRFRSVWTDTDLFSTVSFRVYSTLENPNVLGEYFLLVLPIGAGALLGAEGWKRKVLCGAACLLMGVCLALTYSRGCYLGLLFAAALFLVLLDRRFLILGLVLLVLSPLYLPESILERFSSIGDMADTSTSYRVFIWLGTLAMLKHYWFSGLGPGSAAFNTAYPQYAYNAITAPHSHNLFLQLVCDTGIVGLLLFLALIVSFYRMMFTAIARETDRKARLLQIGGVSAVSGFLVESMTDYTFYNYRVLLLFWVVLGLSVLFCRMGSPREEAA